MGQVIYEIGVHEGASLVVESEGSGPLRSIRPTLRTYAESQVGAHSIASVVVEADRHRFGFADFVLLELVEMQAEYAVTEDQYQRLGELGEMIEDMRGVSVS
jgi:hypothetical protein